MFARFWIIFAVTLLLCTCIAAVFFFCINQRQRRRRGVPNLVRVNSDGNEYEIVQVHHPRNGRTRFRARLIYIQHGTERIIIREILPGFRDYER